MLQRLGQPEAANPRLRLEADRLAEQPKSKLAPARLGVAASLFKALRCKHPPTADHSLRVALSCSAWCARLGMDDPQRQRIELAALMHDIGKLGIPDAILKKPGKLSTEEQEVMSLVPVLGCEILAHCCGDSELLEIIRNATAWYSGRPGQPCDGDELPLGARLLAITDAFDAMTTDQLWQPAMGRELAITNLASLSGIQFDPNLARHFIATLAASPVWPPEETSLSWYKSAPASGALPWAMADSSASSSGGTVGSTFRAPFVTQLIDSLIDAVICIDSSGTIQDWNAAATRLLGHTSSAVLYRLWAPSLVEMREPNSSMELAAEQCPVRTCLTSAVCVAGRFTVRGADNQRLPIEVKVSPIMAEEFGVRGAVLVLRDVTEQSDLEASVKRLRRQIAQDPLTKVGNRAELDRSLATLVEQCARSQQLFSLIVCDIDHFKQVNDVHGHQAGDEALVKVAEILTAQSRHGDLVCRYGGEEFVVLCPDCDIETTVRRAESLRVAIESTRLPMFDNQAVTSSFGVTQYQPGDTAGSIFARADRALLQAKDTGRNRVVRIGSAGRGDANTKPPRRSRWFRWPRQDRAEYLTATLTTPVPYDIVIEMLRGFISDHAAEVLSVAEGTLQLKVDAVYATPGRRRRESRVPFVVSLKISEVQRQVQITGSERTANQLRTQVAVQMTPKGSQLRREKEIKACTRQITLGLNSYLMGQVEDE